MIMWNRMLINKNKMIWKRADSLYPTNPHISLGKDLKKIEMKSLNKGKNPHNWAEKIPLYPWTPSNKDKRASTKKARSTLQTRTIFNSWILLYKRKTLTYNNQSKLLRPRNNMKYYHR